MPGPGTTGGWPVPANTAISRGFGCTSFYTGTKGASCPAANPWWHNGIDFTSRIGTPLYAVRASTVTFAGQDHGSLDCSWMAGSQPPHTGYGKYSKLKDAQGYTWLYGHQSALEVQLNQQVAAGAEIGKMGSSGCATGSHTHLTVIDPSGLDVDPLPLLSKP